MSGLSRFRAIVTVLAAWWAMSVVERLGESGKSLLSDSKLQLLISQHHNHQRQRHFSQVWLKSLKPEFNVFCDHYRTVSL